MKKRNMLFNLLFFGILILGLHINANAQETSVPDGYTGIYNIADLSGIRNNPSGKYILMNDIDMTEDTKKGGDWDNGMGWTPIEEFTGVLNGNGHQIIGMNIYTEGSIEKDCIGLIGSLITTEDSDEDSDEEGVVENLGLINVTINANAEYIGSIAGYSNSGKIRNCYSSGKIRTLNQGNSDSVGGIVGMSAWAQEIKNCFSMIDIVIESQNTSCQAGGISGKGYWFNEIENCYFRGKITGTTHCYGITDSSAKNCFYLKEGVQQNADANGVKALTNVQMKYSQVFTGFDFNNIWNIDSYSNYPYPQLRNNPYIKVKSLQLLSKPSKTVYQQGEKLNLDGSVVRIMYDDGNTVNAVISDDMLGSYDMKKLGKQTISVQYGGKKVSFDIDVKEIFASSIKLSQSKIDVEKGKTYQLKATVYPTNTTNQKLTWTIEDSSIATVNSSGKITAKSAGTTTVWVSTENGKVASCIVNVKVLTVKLRISPNTITLKEGQSIQLKTVISPVDSTEKVTWRSTNSKIAKVDQIGKVTALKSGETTIYATTDNLSYWTGCYVQVKKASTNSRNISVSKTVIKKVSALKKKKALIKYKKVKGASNYQVQYSMKKNFAGAKTKTAKGNSLKVSGLKVKKKYYFRVRVCKKVNGKTYYSGWSNVKSVKAKK